MQAKLTWEEPWGLHVQVSGVITPDEFVAGTLGVTRDRRFRDLRYAILNCLDVESHTFGRDDSIALSSASAVLKDTASTHPHLVCAVVARPPVAELTRRLVTAAQLPWRVGGFDSELKALEWLSTQSLVFKPRPPAAGDAGAG